MDNSYCNATAKPSCTQLCNVQACVVYSWFQSVPSPCNVTCGSGYLFYTIDCVGSDNSTGNAFSLCANSGPQPATQAPCQQPACVCTPLPILPNNANITSAYSGPGSISHLFLVLLQLIPVFLVIQSIPPLPP